MEANVLCLENPVHSLSMKQGCHHIHPERESLSEHQPIQRLALLNVEGKIFSVMAKRMTNFFLANNYVDTSCQKTGVPGFPGCVKHSAMFWEQIQSVKQSKSDLHVVWLRSIPHQLIHFAQNFFHIPSHIQGLVASYFNNFHVCCTTSQDCKLQDISTG